MTQESLAEKNRRVLVGVLSVVAIMVVVAFASVPLYDLFCRVTGFGGTTQRSEGNTNTAEYDREFTIRFDTSVARGMPWSFSPDQKSVKVKVGQDGLASFTALNPTDKVITGTALFNVTPLKAGRYFNKTQCFCFNEQVLNPKQSVHMPVSFYVDPAIMEDENMADVKTITLSYTFFEKDTSELENAMETFYNTPEEERPSLK